jgi:hypothetical protein
MISDETLEQLRQYIKTKKIKEIFASDLEVMLCVSRQTALHAMCMLAGKFPNEFKYYLGGNGIASRLINNDNESIPRDMISLLNGLPAKIMKTD